MRTVRETEELWKRGGKGEKVMGKIKKERGNGDSMWAQEINVVDEEKAKGCVYTWRERLKEAVTERSEVV